MIHTPKHRALSDTDRARLPDSLRDLASDLKGMIHPTPEDRSSVQAQARADYLAECATKAAQAARMASDDVRHAQAVACTVEGAQPIELLLREAIADAVRMADRLKLIASFVARD